MSLLRQSIASGTLWIAYGVLAALNDEATCQAPCETGGVLLGYWTGDDDPVVTHGLGPGPDAMHCEERFKPDHDYHVSEIARLYKASNRRLHYLGDWHSHPAGGGWLSELDRTCLRSIARCRDARVERPLMLILAGGSDWHPFAWRYNGIRRWLLRHSLVVRPLAVCPFRTQ